MKTQNKDYYALLGIDPDATTAEIKRAYRKLAKQYHPDVNNNPDAAERFREITEAYDTLTDPGTPRPLRPPPRHPHRTQHRRRERRAAAHQHQQRHRNRVQRAATAPQQPARSSRSWKTSGWRSAAATRRSPGSSSSSPAAPTANTRAWATTPPAGGTSQANNAPKS